LTNPPGPVLLLRGGSVHRRRRGQHRLLQCAQRYGTCRRVACLRASASAQKCIEGVAWFIDLVR